MVTEVTHWGGAVLYTVGHSARPLEEFLSTLQGFKVTILADLRKMPRSRHNPQFNGDTLAAALRERGIRYVHLEGLTGLRHPRADSPNLGWRNESFRGFADHMLSQAFEDELEVVHQLTHEGTVALMCAEAVPWRCHRSLVADALVARGAYVEDVIGPYASPHRLTSFAKVKDGRVTYPPA